MAKAKPNTNPETELPETEQTETERPETAESKVQTTAETLQFRTASGATFWRCGVQFDGAWQTLSRADFDDAEWARLLDEPMLQSQGAVSDG